VVYVFQGLANLQTWKGKAPEGVQEGNAKKRIEIERWQRGGERELCGTRKEMDIQPKEEGTNREAKGEAKLAPLAKIAPG
jgi:hypothetical protein